MTFDELIARAQAVHGFRQLSPEATAGSVAAALETDAGNVYVGVCIDTACSLGFCAEHAAAAAMITAGENRVVRMVAVGRDGRILPPCGRCREFIRQLHPDNREAEVMVASGVIVRLGQLLPHDWLG
ncbi:cytidine deaminase family protein [Alicyclobacillus sendaiensis]|uniref:Cytidine deaminase n=1 Tax=Alicyclobacillus sendaiensis PA2 TaxID=3029425 RepID=A0ABT6XXA3_ALISE|nr:cytidine deaminase [Alicyclobacillus sendaiensis]MDI9259721.1 cytidine deaminase [Alicyclobacillus sendaiensis PA2]